MKLTRELTNHRIGKYPLVNNKVSNKILKRRSRYDRIVGKIGRIREVLAQVGESYQTHETTFNGLIKIGVSEFFKNFDGRGIEFAIKHMKESRLMLTRYLSGYGLDQGTVVSVTPDGLPTWLVKQIGGIRDLLKDPLYVRGILTVLAISRCFNTKAAPDLESITTPSKANIFEIENDELRRAAKELHFKPYSPKFEEFHSSTKSGPNGQALLSSLYDLTLLPLPLRETIYTIAGEELRQKMEGMLDFKFKDFNLVEWFYRTWKSKDPKDFRKLSFFADKEGKTRVIAILDYWSQTALKPLHDYLNDNLKRIETDCTFNQNHFLNCLRDGPYYSLDLHAATDRMPVGLQERVLAFLIGKTKARAWRSILTDWGFPIRVGNCTQIVKYEAGQPMGAYSSWPAMTITHHLLVKVAALRCGIKNFSSYAILGDDVVIANADVAAKYREILNSLDMPISLVKTHISNDLYEFAKRWVWKGREVTPYSVSSILETWKNYAMFYNSVETQRSHGWEFNTGHGPGSFLEGVMKRLGKPQQSCRTVKLLNTHTLLQDIIEDGLKTIDNNVKDVEGRVSQVWETFALPEIPFSKLEFIIRVLRKKMIEQCAEDKTKLLLSQKSYLALWAEKMKVVTEELGVKASETNRIKKVLIENLPISGVFTSQQKRYGKELEILKDKDQEKAIEVYTSRTLSGSAFNLGVFSMRNSHSRILARSRMVKDFINESRSLLKQGVTLTGFPEPNLKELVKLEKVVKRLLVKRESVSA